MKYIRLRFLVSFVLLLGGVYCSNSQISQSVVEDKFIEIGSNQLHYFDFGGSGTTVLFLQSFHGDASEWIDWRGYQGFAKQFTNSNKVLALTRRGWGKSSKTGWGFDVASQAEDAIRFMDALNIPKAVLVGRSPAHQDILWIAEHHPDRVKGIIFIEPPIVYPDAEDENVREYLEMMMMGACDLGEDAQLIGMSRASWRPHIMSIENPNLSVPTLMFVDPMFPGSPFPVFFEQFITMAKADVKGCNQQVDDYYKSLANNPKRADQLLEDLLEADKNNVLREALSEALGEHLKTIELPELKESDGDFYSAFNKRHAPIFINEMNLFLKNLN